MEWLNDLAAKLPAPRDDEPPELRGQIVKELRDHLQCAFQRELVKAGNETEAARRVLAKFGEPARLARRLWFDAMWEKIMSQRLMLVALLVVILIGLSSMGLTWSMIHEARAVNQGLLEQTRAATEALTRFAVLGNAAGSGGKLRECSPLKVRLIDHEEAAAPLSGFKVTLSGFLFETEPENWATFERTTDKNGEADFGLVRPGEHVLRMVTPWTEETKQTVTLIPGEPQTIDIFPPAALKETDVTIALDWPNDLANRGLWLVCDFVRPPRQVAGQSWGDADSSRQFVAVDAAGKLINFDQSIFPGERMGRGNEPDFFDPRWRISPDSYGIYGLEMRVDVNRRDEERIKPGSNPVLIGSQHIWLPARRPVSRLRWPVGTYRVGHFAVGRELAARDDGLPTDMLHPEFLGGIEIRIPDFEAMADRPNEWRLAPPEPLVRLINGVLDTRQ